MIETRYEQLKQLGFKSFKSSAKINIPDYMESPSHIKGIKVVMEKVEKSNYVILSAVDANGRGYSQNEVYNSDAFEDFRGILTFMAFLRNPDKEKVKSLDDLVRKQKTRIKDVEREAIDIYNSFPITAKAA